MFAKPTSCDTFAVLPPGTDGCVVFGKNSDRPSEEVQEVVYYPSADYAHGTKLKCTYINIDQVPHTYATILSKPSWMWGAEMGANEHGVCIGNEAVWPSIDISPDSTEKLLGMDLLRLGLERAKTSLEALQIITNLLETHGQGGNCSETISNFTYQNSFLIADATEVWILETVKKMWAAEKVSNGVRNISNAYSICTKIDMKSEGLDNYAQSFGLWDPSHGLLNFQGVFGDDDSFDTRYRGGKQLLLNLSSSHNFKETDMFKVLRDKSSGICMSSGSFVSTGSQVSVLQKPGSGKPNIHYFTATPDPLRSVFKPFIFSDSIKFPDDVVSPVPSNPEDRRHNLYKLQENFRKQRGDKQMQAKLSLLESSLVDHAEQSISPDSSVGSLFYDAVKEEIKLYA